MIYSSVSCCATTPFAGYLSRSTFLLLYRRPFNFSLCDHADRDVLAATLFDFRRPFDFIRMTRVVLIKRKRVLFAFIRWPYVRRGAIISNCDIFDERTLVVCPINAKFRLVVALKQQTQHQSNYYHLTSTLPLRSYVSTTLIIILNILNC